MTHHAHDCAFAISHGDEPCDCTGPGPEAAEEPGTASATARAHIAKARELLGRKG